MFDLEQAITAWREHMLAAGIQSPVPLGELEVHLREDIEEQIRTGSSAESAFALASRRMGQPAPLKSEFAQAGGSFSEKFSRLWLALLGLSQPQLVTSMNTPPSNLEPRWATYCKTITFVLPAILLWLASCIFVLPKLKQICVAASTPIPGPMLTAMALSELFKNHLFICSLLFLCALALLEWRSRAWPRHRRLVFGIAAFAFNSVALLAITTLFVLAVFAGANLLPHTR